MKTEENKKQEELTDEQLDNVAGGTGKVPSKKKGDSAYPPKVKRIKV
jgi:hypothetical protein